MTRERRSNFVRRAQQVIVRFANGELNLTQARELLDYLENEEARLSPTDATAGQARGLRLNDSGD